MKKKYIVLLVILAVLIGARVSMPYFVVKYVNKVLSEIPGYQGHISDVDLCLVRGAYTIDSLSIEKIEGDQPVPFFSATAIDLSIHWKAIFNGSIVGEIVLEQPSINFVAAEDTTNAQYGEDVDWTKPIKDLMPLQINLFTVNSGEIHFRNYASEPPVDVYLNQISLKATNLNNAKNVNDTLPSHVVLNAISLGDGNLTLEGDMNILKEIPDFDLNLEFENVDVTALNDFLKAYANVDAESGEFYVYAEFLALDGELDGYVKPLLIDLKLVDPKGEREGLKLIWEAIVGTVVEIFENQPKDQFATKVPLEGNLNDPDAGILPTIWNIFSNAFVDAFKKQTDNSIDFGKNLGSEEKTDKK